MLFNHSFAQACLFLETPSHVSNMALGPIVLSHFWFLADLS